MITATLRVASISCIFPTAIPWASLAASSGAFSRTSPSAAARWISSTILTRSFCNCVNCFFISLYPLWVKRILRVWFGAAESFPADTRDLRSLRCWARLMLICSFFFKKVRKSFTALSLSVASLVAVLAPKISLYSPISEGTIEFISLSPPNHLTNLAISGCAAFFVSFGICLTYV